MRAQELCALASDWLARTYPGSLIVTEFSVGVWGKAMLDLAAITQSEIIGVEIKGDGDSPSRMALQAAIYSKAATRMYFLAAPDLDDRCSKHLPSSWGRLRIREGAVERDVRPFSDDQEPPLLCVAPAQLLQCLWRSELDEIARINGVITGNVYVEKLRWELAEQVPLRTLRLETCLALHRRLWRHKSVRVAPQIARAA